MHKNQKTNVEQPKPAPAAAGSGIDNVRYYQKRTSKNHDSEFCNRIHPKAVVPIVVAEWLLCAISCRHGEWRVSLNCRSHSLPQMAGGSASALSLVASLLRLHSHYGPPDRTDAQGDLCHEASARPVTRTKLLVSYRTYRQLSVWNLPPLVFRAFGAHCQTRTLGIC